MRFVVGLALVVLSESGARGASTRATSAPSPSADGSASPAAAATPPISTTSEESAVVYEEEDVNEAASLSFVAEGEVSSRFVWRGIALSDGPVFQPSVAMTGAGFTFASVANLLLNDEPPASRVNLVINELMYTLVLGRLKVQPGVVLYANVDDPYTVEGSLDVSYKLGLFRVLSTNRIDVRQAPGGYFGTLGLGYERKIHNWTTRATAEVGWATAGFNELYLGERVTALNVAEVGLSARYDLSRLFFFTLRSELSTLLAARLRSSVQSPVLANGGAGFGVGF